MNGTPRQLFILLFIIWSGTSFMAGAQSQWQWGKRGGSPASSTGPGSSGPEEVIDMTTDKNGNVYVLASNSSGALAQVDGHFGIGPGDRLTLASWKCNGQFRWMKTFGASEGVSGTGLGVDTLGGVYVSGATTSTNSLGYAYFNADTLLGYTTKSMFLIKYDTTGVFKWLKMPQPDTVGVGNSSGIYGMDVSKSGEIFTFCLLTPGSYNAGAVSITAKKYYVLKYNKDGVYQSKSDLEITVSGDATNGFGYGTLGLGSFTHFSRDHRNGRFYLLGQYNKNYGNLSFGTTAISGTGGISGYPIFLAAFNSSGTKLWTKQSSANGYVINRNCKAVIDNESNIYIGGDAFADGSTSFNGYTFDNSLSTTNAIPFVISLDTTGTNRWATSAGANNFTTGGAIAYANNTIAMSGAFPYKLKWGSFIMETNIGATGGFYPFIAKLSAANGSVLGLDSIRSGAFDNQSTAITLDKNNNIYTGGRFGGKLYIAGDSLSNAGGDFDWFIAKYGSANCNCTLPQPNYSFAITAPNALNFTYTGTTPYTSISWNFGDGSAASTTANPSHIYNTAGTYTVCVTVTNACGSNVYCKQITSTGTGIGGPANFSNIDIYPNPATQTIYIDHAIAGTMLELYNVTGSRLLHTVLKGGRDILDVHELQPGIYLLRFTGKDGTQGTMKFVKRQ